MIDRGGSALRFAWRDKILIRAPPPLALPGLNGRDGKKLRIGWNKPPIGGKPPAMDDPRISPSSAGGIALAVTILAGAIIGIMIGQPSAGLVIGAATGALIAAALWWIDRSR